MGSNNKKKQKKLLCWCHARLIILTFPHFTSIKILSTYNTVGMINQTAITRIFRTVSF